MADDAATSADESHVTFNVKAANDQKHLLTLPTATSVGDLKAKLATPEYADISPDRQRLIYSGRVLKDHDTLASVKIKDGHTIHLVKGAASNARQNPAHQATSSTAAGGGSPAPQVPTNIAAGTGNNPLAGLTGARYAGFHGLPGMETFGPDGGMGPPPTQESMLEMMDNPMFLSQMNEAMNNPAVVDMMMQNPMIRDNPMLQEILRNEDTRRMMFSPEMMRMQMQMQRAMNRNGGGGGSSFPAPGATDNTPQPSATVTDRGTTATPSQPNMTGATDPAQPGGAHINPFASLFPGANPLGQMPQNTTPDAGSQNASAAANPFGDIFGGGQGGQNPMADMARDLMRNPEAMRQALQMMNGAGGGANPFGAFGQAGSAGATPGSNSPAPNPFAALLGGGGGGFGTPPPADTRPPEQIYESQLAQLNEMGFYEFERNISALRRSGGNVQGAVEYLLNGGS
ncbi:hypothetical protein BDU57DRAFT_518987 [Ampelomyces quisqualis]|uniref:Ubiquitin-like protein DskB n=1 Tax=Ampelomyces quisqualis TaxID=50730 RepID=A0A6A5QF29_AMPQU|nr:hypothetical protein BDU57DRAFT_518987 [Ampelomyces quisqualis]